MNFDRTKEIFKYGVAVAGFGGYSLYLGVVTLNTLDAPFLQSPPERCGSRLKEAAAAVSTKYILDSAEELKRLGFSDVDIIASNFGARDWVRLTLKSSGLDQKGFRYIVDRDFGKRNSWGVAYTLNCRLAIPKL